MSMDTQLRDLRETAQTFRVSVFTIRRLIRRGELKAVRVGRQLRIPQTEINRIAKGKSA